MAQFPATEIPREHRPPVDEHGTAPDGANAVRSSAATTVASERAGASQLHALAVRHQTLAGRPETRVRDSAELTGFAG
ncbi:hypothetical protein BBW68_00755 [Candidatus Erwinia dacicola]|uniref:Uncharacterized protein n=1 Tax=Candidatus Erwinia dacicola TaxID=252393 RepID=A0A1E7Z4H8_9GAMM|nr:hypothetical protein BBW68_00755 [Candidatus Erwinia dacicola]